MIRQALGSLKDNSSTVATLYQTWYFQVKFKMAAAEYRCDLSMK